MLRVCIVPGILPNFACALENHCKVSTKRFKVELTFTTRQFLYIHVAGPALDAIAIYPIRVDEQSKRVIARLPENEETPSHAPAIMAKRDLKNKTSIGIVGGGPAALAAAETLRQVS